MRQNLLISLLLAMLTLPWLAVLNQNLPPAVAAATCAAVLVAAFLPASAFQAVRALLSLLSWCQRSGTTLGEHRTDLTARAARSRSEKHGVDRDGYTQKVALAVVLVLIGLCTLAAEITLLQDMFTGRQLASPDTEPGLMQQVQHIAFEYSPLLYAVVLVTIGAVAHLFTRWLDIGSAGEGAADQFARRAMITAMVIAVLTTITFGLDQMLANHLLASASSAPDIDPGDPYDFESVMAEFDELPVDADLAARNPAGSAPAAAEPGYDGWAFTLALILLRLAPIAALTALAVPFAFLVGQLGPALRLLWLGLVSLIQCLVVVMSWIVSMVYLVLHYLVGLPILFVQLVAAPLADRVPWADSPDTFRRMFDLSGTRESDDNGAPAAPPNSGETEMGKMPVGPHRADDAPVAGDDYEPRRSGASWSPFE